MVLVSYTTVMDLVQKDMWTGPRLTNELASL